MIFVPSTHKKTNRKSPQKSGGLLFCCFLGITLLLNSSCRENGTPKPTAYPRITYPKTGYQRTNNLPYPVHFEYPSFATLSLPSEKGKKQSWININFDKYHATLLTSYSKISIQNIRTRIVENESIIEKETPSYAHIRKQEYMSTDSAVTGYLYEIDGNTACPLQFILSDQNGRLFRGALYFDYTPNRDSIKDILNGMTTDVRYLMESFRFKP